MESLEECPQDTPADFEMLLHGTALLETDLALFMALVSMVTVAGVTACMNILESYYQQRHAQVCEECPRLECRIRDHLGLRHEIGARLVRYPNN